MNFSTVHIPVMKDEVVEFLRAREGGMFLDCTLGGAGHTEAILEAHPKNRVIAFDRDARAIERAKTRLKAYEGRFKLYHGRFSQAKKVVEKTSIDGMIIDLGLSTDQLREGRGFSFSDTSPLDMRMDESEKKSAFRIVNELSEHQLLAVLRRGGVGPEAVSVMRAIIAARPIETTKALSDVINRAASGKARKKKINPSTVVFQAIRIAVNDEFEEIEEILETAPELVKGGGRLAVITFHSLEDKAVTRTLRSWESEYPASWRGPRDKSLGKMVKNAAIVPSEEEKRVNPSSRSARLRVFEFVR